MPETSFPVAAEDIGERVDVFLVHRIEGLGRARAKALCEEGKVRVNGKRVAKGTRLFEGDVVSLDELPSPSRFEALPDPDLPLRIVFEDADLVVVDKDPHVPSHPLRADERGTVASALVARYPEMRGVGHSPREPGLVHRLDTGTSGLVIAARNAQAFEALTRDLRAGRIDKRYLALVEGRVREGLVIDLPIAGDPSDPSRVRVVDDPSQAIRLRALPARTEVITVSPLEGARSLVEVRARSARRHQVRVHLAWAGHPLLGDLRYGGPSVPGLDRHALHASRLVFAHPRTGETLTVASELPKDLADVARPSVG